MESSLHTSFFQNSDQNQDQRMEVDYQLEGPDIRNEGYQSFIEERLGQNSKEPNCNYSLLGQQILVEEEEKESFHEKGHPASVSPKGNLACTSKKKRRQSSITEFFKNKEKVLKSEAKKNSVIFRMPKFTPDKITYYFRKYPASGTWRGVPYSVFEIILKYLTLEEAASLVRKTCKAWKSFFAKFFWSYSSIPNIDLKRESFQDLSLIFKKADGHLLHVRVLKNIIRRDFGNSVKYFYARVNLSCSIADRLFTGKKNGARSRLFKTFKISSRSENISNNFLSNHSFQEVCHKSQFSLAHLSLKNTHLITFEVIHRKVSNSFKDQASLFQISHFTRMLCDKRQSVKMRKLVGMMRFLQGLDISECKNVHLAPLLLQIMCRNSKSRHLKVLLLEQLELSREEVTYLAQTNVQTLSLKGNGSLEGIQLLGLSRMATLLNLNILGCSSLTERDIYLFLKEKVGQTFKILKTDHVLSQEAKILLNQLQNN